MKNDIYPGVHYCDNTELFMYTYVHGTCPKAHEITQYILAMPLHMYLTDDVREIAEIADDFVKCSVENWGVMTCLYRGVCRRSFLKTMCVNEKES